MVLISYTHFGEYNKVSLLFIYNILAQSSININTTLFQMLAYFKYSHYIGKLKQQSIKCVIVCERNWEHVEEKEMLNGERKCEE